MSNINYKTLSKDQLKMLLSGFKFRVEPMQHQMAAIVFALDKKRTRVQYFMDIGTGKTSAALFTAQAWGSKKILVVCPISAFWAWNNDIKNHTYYSHEILDGSFEDRVNKFCTNKDIFIINYDGLKTLFADHIKPIKHKNGKVTPGFWSINEDYFYNYFDTVIFDEVHKCKNTEAIQTKICYELSKRAKFAIGLTGTPYSDSYQDLFGEFLVVDLGKSLGNNFYQFRRKYFEGFRFNRLKPNADLEILKKIAPISLSYGKRECLDLPERYPPVVRKVKPTQEQKKLLEAVFSDLAIEFDEGSLNITNVANRSSKARQIACGFVYLKDNDEKSVKYLKQNPKIMALKDIIEECSFKLVVFHNLESEAILIEELCKRENIKYSAIRGSIKKEDRMIEYEKFRYDPSVKLMIGQYECASESYDMTCADVMVFFSPIASPRLRDQSEGRIDRNRQTKRTLFIDIIMEGSTDEIVLDNRHSKQDIANSLLEFIRTYH